MDARLHKILRTLDVEAVRADFVRTVGQPVQEPGKGDPILASLHRARIMAGRAFSGAERQISRDWLAANGYEPVKE